LLLASTAGTEKESETIRVRTIQLSIRGAQNDLRELEAFAAQVFQKHGSIS
jgi:hypothetical protein